MKRNTQHARAARPAAHRTDEPLLKVTFPGRLHKRGTRWWWEVQLPGEDRTRTRPLRLPEAKAATDDRKVVEKIAFEMWEQALRETTERRIRAEADQKIARLKAQFLEKVQNFSSIVEDATAKAEAETRAREELEARLKQVAAVPAQPRPCECCGTVDYPAADLTQISSGQWLCPDCMAVLRAAAQRARAQESAQLCEA
jgi:hypothetical protein